MNRSTNILLIGAAFILATAALAQTGAQASTQAKGQVTVQTDKTQAQASGGASASASTQSRQANAGLASGTAFNATLNSPVDSKKCKPGDPVTAHTTESVKSDGNVVLPKGTKLVGRVTQSSARAQGDAESALAIAFDHAILKNGQKVPLNVAMQAIASAQTAASASESDADAMGSMGTSAAGSGMARSRGAVGGLTSTASSAAGSLTNTAATVGGTGNTAVHSTAGVASSSLGAVGSLNAAGQFTSASRGVFGLPGVSLNSVATNNGQGSIITSAGKNVRLDAGTRMLMVIQTSVSGSPAR